MQCFFSASSSNIFAYKLDFKNKQHNCVTKKTAFLPESVSSSLNKKTMLAPPDVEYLKAKTKCATQTADTAAA
jgi:hypothetical protein